MENDIIQFFNENNKHLQLLAQKFGLNCKGKFSLTNSFPN